MNDIKLPRGWQKKKLVDISDVKGGKRLPKGYELSDSFNGFPYIRVVDMYMGGINLENIKYVPLDVVESIKNYKITVEDLFISVAGTIGIVGEVPSVLNNANLTENADKITNIKIDKGYLLEYLKSSIIQSVISREMTTSAQPKLAIERIKKFEIRYPQDRKEQQKIAKILSTIDKNIEKTIEIIEKYKKVKNGLMDDLLTGKIRIKDGKWIKETEFKYVYGIADIPKDWEVKKLSSIAQIVMGQSPSSENYNEDGKGMYLIQGNGDCSNRKTSPRIWTTEITKKCDIGDIIMTVRAPAGEIAKSYHAACIGRGVCAIKYKYGNDYLYYYLLNIEGYWERLAQGTTFTAINSKDIKELRVAIPKLRSEQQVISNILLKQDQLIEKEEQYLQKLQKLKNGLMNDLLTGKKRVKID